MPHCFYYLSVCKKSDQIIWITCSNKVVWPVLFLKRDNVLISGLSVHKMMGDKERLGPKIDMSDDEDRLLITGWSLTLDNLVFHQLLRSHLCWLGLKWDHLFENPKVSFFTIKAWLSPNFFETIRSEKKSSCWYLLHLKMNCGAFLHVNLSNDAYTICWYP